MDVADALRIMRRRWWLIVGLPLLVLVVSVLTVDAPPATYEARLRIAVDIPRELVVEGSDEGTAAKIGEALIDDVARIIPSQAFAAAVADRLPASVVVEPGQIASDLSATDRHRVADVWVRRTVSADATEAQRLQVQADLQAVAEAAVEELEQDGNKWFSRLGEDNVTLTVIDRPAASVVPPSLRRRLELPLRVALALLVGLGLAFLLHAVDPKLYAADEVHDATGADVVGRIPKRHRGWRDRL